MFVDTAPLMEKPLAQAAGLGWQGKHTNLVSRDFGSWLFLGAILTDAALAPDAAEADHCGACRACLDICPTDAFPAPYQLDARACLSYLTIEHAGPIPRALPRGPGQPHLRLRRLPGRLPLEQVRPGRREAALHAREALQRPPLAELAGLDDAGLPRPVRQEPDQAHRPRPVRAQRALRDRQFGRSAPGRRRPRRGWTTRARPCAKPPPGRWGG